MSQALALYRLQDVELQLLRRQKRLAEIMTALDDRQAIDHAQQAVEAAQRALAPLQTRARNLELEIQSNLAKIQAADEALYSGRIRNPKELQDLQQEIQALNRRNSDLEDTLLETMLAVEAAEAALAQAHQALEQTTAAWNDQHSQLLEEQAQLKTERAALLKQREQALANLDAASLSEYNALKPRKQNQPVALLVGGSCAVCGVEQTQMLVSEVMQGNKLVKCLSCGRILAYGSSA